MSTPTNGQYQADNVPPWTVGADSMKNFEMNKSPADSNDIPAPSAPSINDLPPNYFDISIVPNNAVLHYNEVAPHTGPSMAIIERKNEGVMSLDALIDRNPDQLWLYFMTYLNEKPSLNMTIHGYHIQVVDRR
jgi:hypothetical protein